MSQNILIIGAVALGPKAACRLRRLDSDANITMIDKDQYISYGGCGIPYYVGGDVAELEGLQSTSAHVLRDAKFFKNAKRVDVLTQTEVVEIIRKEKNVRALSLIDNREIMLPYDKLVIASGALPVVPPIPGANLPGVTVVSNLGQAKAIKDRISKGEVERAVVIGGGAIGIEMAEALTDLWGVETTLVEMQDQLLPTAACKDMARIIENHMIEKDVQLLIGEQVTEILGDQESGVTGVMVCQKELPCDLVVLAVGVRPNSKIAEQAGLDLGPAGGILVDDTLRTSDADIFAGGDCVEIPNLITGKPGHFPLGSLANRQGRVIGTNLAGGEATFKGAVGSFGIKVFDLSMVSAGLTVYQAKAAGFDPAYTVVAQADRAHFYPTQDMMVMKLIACRKTRRVLGVEAVGPDGDAVKARVDAVAVLLSHEVTLDEISNLEVAYAPPMASAMDIVNSAANALENTIEARHRPVDVIDFLEAFKNNSDIQVLDVRSAKQAGPFIKKYGSCWQNIPQEELSYRAEEVKQSSPIYLVCGSGPRSYEAQLLLSSKGMEDTLNIQGGIKMIKSSDPEFSPEE